ncbi:sulfurtransferase TusA family protein [Caenispirillum salinarum]|uniref:sulfurtransferase TusA family protein n=1 Tax=Caenispirillum salinarum TaxID=859058 RepID=UPI00384DF013
MTDTAADTLLDVRGLQCPLPVLRAKKALNALASGQLLEVHATDPGAVPDFKSLCAQTGHVLERQWQDGEVFGFLIRKS